MDGGEPQPPPPPPPLLASHYQHQQHQQTLQQQQQQPPAYHHQLLYSQHQQQPFTHPQPQQQHHLHHHQQLASHLAPPPPPPPNYPSVPRLPKKRTRTGCLTCRKRKHKCGEERPQCARCLRAGMECIWPAEPAAAAAGVAGGGAVGSSASSGSTTTSTTAAPSAAAVGGGGGGAAAAAGAGPSSASFAAESAKAKARPYPPPHKRASSSSSSTRTTLGGGGRSRGTSGDRSSSAAVSSTTAYGGGHHPYHQQQQQANGASAQTTTSTASSSTTSSPRPLGHPHLFHPPALPSQQLQPFSSSGGGGGGAGSAFTPHPLSQEPAGLPPPHPQLQTVILNQPTYPILSPFAPTQTYHPHQQQQQQQPRGLGGPSHPLHGGGHPCPSPSSSSSSYALSLQHQHHHYQQQQQQQTLAPSAVGLNHHHLNAEAGPSFLTSNGDAAIISPIATGSGSGDELGAFQAYFAGYTAEQWAAMLDPAALALGGRPNDDDDDGGLLLDGMGNGGGALELGNGPLAPFVDPPSALDGNGGGGGGGHPHHLLQQQAALGHLVLGSDALSSGSGGGGGRGSTDPSVLDLHAAWLALDASSSAAVHGAGGAAGEPSPSLWLHSSPPALLDGGLPAGGGRAERVDEPDPLVSGAGGGRRSDGTSPTLPPSLATGIASEDAAAAAGALRWVRTPSPSSSAGGGGGSGAITSSSDRHRTPASSPPAADDDRMTGIVSEPRPNAAGGSTPRGRQPFRSESGFQQLQQHHHHHHHLPQQQQQQEAVKAWSPSQWKMMDEDEDDGPLAPPPVPQQQQRTEPTGGGGGQVSLPRYTTPTSSLVLLFPNPEERHLMQHFLYSVPALFVGIQASSPLEMAKFATEEHPNLNSFFPFLDIPHFLSLPRGQSSAADALALSLMSVGAGRLSHLYHSEAGEDPSVEGNSRRYEELSVALMQASLGLGQTSLAFARLKGKGFGPALSIGSASASSSAAAAVDGTVASGALPQQQQQQPGPGMDDSEITHLLAACSSCILARCLAGGRGFEGALDLARGVVEFAGGPKKMLDALSSSGGSSSASTSAPPPAAGSATITSLDPPSMSTTTGYPTAGGSLGASSLTTPTTTSKATRRKRLRMLRSVLEDLASWDLFASLSSGAKPSAFSSSSPHAANSGGGLAEWLFAYSPPSGTREGTSGEEDWETLESTLGFSRILMDLFSRVNVLYATSRSPPAGTAEPQTATLAIQLLHEIRIRKADVLRSYPELAQPFFPGPSRGDELEAEEELGRRVRYGRLGRDDEHEGEGLGRGKARRLQFGDLIWTLTLEIMVRTEVQDEPTDSAEIKALANRIVTLVQEAHRRSLVTLGFLWPLIIAGTMFDAEADRQAARAAIETLRSYTCFDLQSGQEILREVWNARDAGDRRATFRDVAPRCGTVVL